MKLSIVLTCAVAALIIACAAEPAPPAPSSTVDNATGAEVTPVPTPTQPSPGPTGPEASEPTSPPGASAGTVPAAAPTSVPEPPVAVTSAPDPPAPTPTPEPILPATPTPVAQPATPTVLRVRVAVVPAGLPAYDRDDWRHWADRDGDCQDTRQEVLIAESTTDVAYRTDRRCRVATGQWLAPYSATIVTDPGDLDVDHMVPLANAHDSGAWGWSAERRELYANYLDAPEHLIAVTARANRSKGARGPDRWKPEDRTYWCQYAIDWITIKAAWELTVTGEEHAALGQMLGTCSNPPVLTTSGGGATGPVPAATHSPIPRPTSTPTLSPTTTYASCDAAEAAGEPRVQGAKGPGRGFPKWMVPSARDGDGDGVVCER